MQTDHKDPEMKSMPQDWTLKAKDRIFKAKVETTQLVQRPSANVWPDWMKKCEMLKWIGTIMRNLNIIS